MIYKIRNNFSVNDHDTEALSLEIISQKSNIFINTTYRKSSVNKENVKNYFGKFLKKTKQNKITYLLGDFNLNLLDFDTNFKVKSDFNTAFSHNFIPMINKSTHVRNHSANIIDHILTNSCDSKIDTSILKVEISDHFSIFFAFKIINVKTRLDLVFVKNTM